MSVDVSVVVPVWQPRADWLAVAVHSALAERDVAIEVLLVDDGCDPPVAEVLVEIADPRLRVERVAHAGVCAARNAGTELARGTHVRFLDADDAIVAGSTARLLALAGADKIAYGSTAFCDDALRLEWTLRATQTGELAEACLLGAFRARLQGMVFPRAVLVAAGPWDPAFRVMHDRELVLRTLELAPAVADPALAGLYRRHPGGLTARVDDALDDMRRLVPLYLERHPEARGTALERRAQAAVEALSARVSVTHGRPRDAVVPLARALARDPRAITREVTSALPALGARLRRRLRRSAPAAPGSSPSTGRS